MSIVVVLIPLGIVLVGIAAWAFIWAVNHGQFEDLDQAAHSILFDDDLRDGDRPPNAEESRAREVPASPDRPRIAEE